MKRFFLPFDRKKYFFLPIIFFVTFITNLPSYNVSFGQIITPQIPNQTISILAVGDIMMGSTWPPNRALPPDDGAAMFDEVKPILTHADITFGNLEGPLMVGGISKKCGPNSTDCYAFRMPVRYAQHLKNAGFTVLGLANNHAMDFGKEGRANTMHVLDSLGMLHSGAVGDIARMNIKGKKISLIAFSYDEDSYNLNDIKSATAAVSLLAKESDIVIVSFHGGAEGASRQHVPHGHEKFLGEDRGDLRTFTHAVIDSGAHLVIGHGPHVLRGMELYKNRLIAYSLGNFATYGQFTLSGPNGISCILEVHLNPDGSFNNGLIHPVKQLKPGGPKIDSTNAVIPILQQLSKQDFPDSQLMIDDGGKVFEKK